MNTAYRKNLKDAMTACKDYTDTQIAQAKEEIYWHIGEYSVTTSDDNTSASVKTVPSNATRCKIKRVYGNTQKLNPTTASDSTSAMMKTMPSTVYDFDVSKVEGNSEKSENLLYSLSSTITTQGLTFDVSNGNINVSGTPTSSYAGRYINSYLPNNSLVGTHTLANFTNDFPANCFLRLTFEKNGSRVYTFTLGASRQSSTYTFDGTETSFVLEYAFQNSTLTAQNGNIKPMLVKSSTAPTEFKVGYTGIHNFAWTGIVIKDSNDDTQQTIPIDLSTILYNGNPLFEENALKGVGTAKDYITPYKACKVMGRVDLSTLNWVYYENQGSNALFEAAIGSIKSDTSNLLCSLYSYTIPTSLNTDNLIIGTIGNQIRIRNTAYTSASAFKTAMSGVYLLYELATPIEVSINWASTLRGITGYSNGTITLLNTYNMDSANTITYNSIIKENCCAKMVQSRNGSVIKTINFPTQASDGYSAGSVSNVRDFTTNKRIGNVSKEGNLGGLTWAKTTYFVSDAIGNIKAGVDSVVSNALCAKYETSSYNGLSISNGIAIGDNKRIYVKDTNYTDASIFKTAMANEPLYYELADASKTETSIDSVENVIEVEPSDVLSFYDSDDNLVTVPSDLTYRIEVAN